MLVIDASVAVKWFVPEENADKASAILTSHKKLIAPEIIRIEVAATFMRLLRMQCFDHSDAETSINKWADALARQTITLDSTVDHFEEAIEISTTIGHQLQDCLYLAVARQYKAPLVTADEKLHKKSVTAGYEVILL